MWPFKKNKIESVDLDVVTRVSDIGRMKKELPATQRGWCNQLGLYVQLNEVMGYGKLQAGSKYSAHFLASRDNQWDEWKIKRYENGDWERLVKPSHQLTWWISQMGGMPDEFIDHFEDVAEQIRQTGDMSLLTEITDLEYSP